MIRLHSRPALTAQLRNTAFRQLAVLSDPGRTSMYDLEAFTYPLIRFAEGADDREILDGLAVAFNNRLPGLVKTQTYSFSYWPGAGRGPTNHSLAAPARMWLSPTFVEPVLDSSQFLYAVARLMPAVMHVKLPRPRGTPPWKRSLPSTPR